MTYKEKIKSSIKKIAKSKIIWAIIILMAPVLLEIYKFKKIEINAQSVMRIGYIYAVYAAIAVFYLLNKFSNVIKRIVDFLVKYRYIIAGFFLVLIIVFKINFSSIGMWSQYMNEQDTSNEIFGEARGIRSDEWLTQSSFMIGQASSEKYEVHNKKIAQGTSNMLMISAPVTDIVEICRPLLWGFHFLDVERGFSFYWGLKIVALVLVSMELIKRVSKKNNNLLILIGGLVFAMAPPLMWWLSTAVVDGYIYGAAVIVLFGYYMNNLENYKIWRKILIAIGIIICLPGFAFMLYPAFQVPFGFFMAIFMGDSLIKNWKKLRKTDYLLMTISLILSLGLVARFVMLSLEDMKTMLGTVYPGNRLVTGGTLNANSYVNYFVNIFFPYTENIVNTCEPSTYIYSLTGLVIVVIAYLKNIKAKVKNENTGITLALIMLFVVYTIWEFIGFNELLSKITLLSYSPAERTHIITGMIGLILSIIMVQGDTDNGNRIFTKKQSILISLVVVFVAYVLAKQSIYMQFFTSLKYEIVLSMIFALTYFIINYRAKEWIYTMLIVAVVAGVKVNPIAVGISPINKTDISAKIREIDAKEEDNLWIGSTNITGQYLVANGVNCLNGVHTYPDFKWLRIVDPKGEFDEKYNRFAHISVNLSEETSFQILAPDAYVANLTYDNVKDIGVKFYFTMSKLSDETVEMFHLQTVYSDEVRSQYIYEIN